MAEEEIVREQPVVEVAECPCEIPLQPMAEWVKVADEGSCRPCVIAPVVSWYHEQLTEDGEAAIAQRLQDKVEVMDEDKPEDVIALCQELDKIKGEVQELVRKRLEEFDCAVQSFDPNAPDAGEEEGQPSSESPEASSTLDSPAS